MADTPWEIVGGKLTNPDLPPVLDEPFKYDMPHAMWRIDPDVNDGFPYNMLLPGIVRRTPGGAFMNAHSLEHATIPETCKKIGEWAFTNTALRNVKIPEDCEYYPTSFPEGCEVGFYGGGGDYGQLYDSEGYEVLDADSARIYVKGDQADG